MSVLNKLNGSMSDRSHILVVDDDTRICNLVSRFLQENDFIVMTAESAIDAQEVLERFEFDAIVLDVMMPGMTGTELVQKLRQEKVDTPILLLTALGESEDRITGFESGADDYLPKPFEPRELVLRLKSILRRTQKPSSGETEYRIGNWTFNPKHDELREFDNTEHILGLTSVEANLLRALAESANDVVSREELAKRCDLDMGERTIDVQMTRLRRKVEENTRMPRFLQTVRGKGYILRAERM